jgi:tetratricopeptide (TPR) repeat protein
MSLLMEALKKAEREKFKAATDESAPEGSSAGPEPLQGEDPFPPLKWTEPTPGDSAPAISLAAYPHPNLLPKGEGAIVKGAGFDLLPPESAPTTATTIPPIAATGPAFSPSADATRPQSAIPPLQTPAGREEPAPVVSPWSLQSSGNPAGTLLAGESQLPRTEPPLRNGTPAAGKQPLAQETTTAQRQRHAANVLAATKKTPGRNRLPLAAASAAAILLFAGGAYLYWQYPQLSAALNQGGLHPAPTAPPPVAAAMATVAPSPLPAPLSSPLPMPAAVEATASNPGPPGERQMPPPPAATLAEQAPKESAITIRRSTHKDQVAPALARGYSAFMAGNDDLAQQEYTSILRQDGNNRDALLGIAAIAAKRGRSDEAIRTYLHLLDLDPRDPTAQAGMLSLTAGQADPVQNESRVKTLLSQQPDAHYLHFALANLYASQSRWPEAQQEYFHAYQRAPDNPDYLYNLAISLDHLNQGKLALEYYQRALALSQKGSANFDKFSTQNRIKELQLPAIHKP